MQTTRPDLLLTRPRADAERLANELGVAAHISPVLGIAPVPISEQPLGWQTLLFTSRHGVAAARAAGLSGTAFCVGDSTAQAARTAGFAAIAASGDVEHLIQLCRLRPEAAPFWHLRGAHSRGALTERLNQAGLRASATICYHQHAQPLDARARALIEGADPVVFPLFSPRSAKLSAAGLVPGPRLIVVCFSGAVLEALPGTWQDRARVAPEPTIGAMCGAIRTALDLSSEGQQATSQSVASATVHKD